MCRIDANWPSLFSRRIFKSPYSEPLRLLRKSFASAASCLDSWIVTPGVPILRGSLSPLILESYRSGRHPCLPPSRRATKSFGISLPIRYSVRSPNQARVHNVRSHSSWASGICNTPNKPFRASRPLYRLLPSLRNSFRLEMIWERCSSRLRPARKRRENTRPTILNKNRKHCQYFFSDH